ncbi:MAG: hypothetical protein RSF40_01800 [Oscillospiraceae bacterium]
MKRLDGENERQYLWRVGQLVDNGEYQNWKEIAPIINAQWREDESTYRDESAYRKPVQYAKGFYEDVFAPMMQGDEYLQQLQIQRDEIFKLKKQFFDQRREYNKLRTPDARAEHLGEYLKQCAKDLNNFIPLNFDKKLGEHSEKEAVLCLADWHYGMITDNIWNTYDIDICKKRVEQLVLKCKERIELHKPKALHILLLGDLADGCIHTSSRVAQEEVTCNQIMQVSEILAEAINELANSSSIECTNVYSTYGNHMRSIQDKKDSIHADNMEKLISWWLKPRLQNRKDIHVIDANYKEFIKLNVCGYNICCTHGDLDSIKNLGMIVNTIFTKKFGETIDYTISADKHHLEEFESFDIENILIRSLCGCDNFANGKRLYSNAGQTLMFFTEEDGRETTCNIRLN